jgi:hypothetical protein
MTNNIQPNNLTNQHEDSLNRFKVMTSIQHMEIVEGAVDAILKNLTAIEAGRKVADKAQSGQLEALNKALKDYAEPLTEEVWEKVYRANVAARLDEATSEGTRRRYANKASRDVMVNLIKVAAMGLTLAKHDRKFQPSYQAQSNLKKYATEVRPKLQAEIDPATEKPRLRSIAAPPKAEKKLPEGAYYWLIGCEDAKKGIQGANTVIGGGFDLRRLEDVARRKSSQYEIFLYCVAKLEDMNLDKEDKFEDIPIQNSAVLAEVISISSNANA